MGLRIAGGIDDAQWRRLAVELEHRSGALEEACGDGDDLAGEVSEGDLVHDATDAHGRVAADAAASAHREGGPELVLVDAHLVALGEHGGRGAPEDASVGRMLVEACEPRLQFLLNVD